MVMRQMRDNTKWIMIATGVAFVALMVFSWGMDITGRNAGQSGADIGSVNGVKVAYNEWQAVYKNLYEQAQQQQQEPISTAQNKQLEDQAWDQMVNRVLVKQELDRRGIRVTDEEIRQAARFQPPAELETNPSFQTNGKFDLVKYQQYLQQAASANPEVLQQLEAYYRDQLPQGKLLRQISTGVYVSDAELWDRWKDAHETATVKFVELDPVQRLPDDSVQVTDAEMEAYWNAHQKDFEEPARATVKVLALSRVPTAADTAAAKARAAGLVTEINGGANFDTVAAREKKATQPATVEDLGTFGHGTMEGAFDTAAFKAPVGKAYGPVKTSFGYHVVLVSKRTADSVTAKHILIKIARTEASEDSILALADSLEKVAEHHTLDETAKTFGMSVINADITDAFPFVADVGQVSDGADWVFGDAQPNDVSEVFENPTSFYVMQLISKKPGGVLPLADAKASIRTILTVQKKVDKAAVAAQALVQKVKGGATLEAAAADLKLDVKSPPPFSRGDFVPGMGAANGPIGAAFGLPVRAVSEPIKTKDNVYVIQKIAETPADSAAWAAQKEGQRRSSEMMLQQQRIQQWMAGLKAAAKIVDRRAEVLKAQTDTTTAKAPVGPNRNGL